MRHLLVETDSLESLGARGEEVGGGQGTERQAGRRPGKTLTGVSGWLQTSQLLTLVSVFSEAPSHLSEVGRVGERGPSVAVHTIRTSSVKKRQVGRKDGVVGKGLAVQPEDLTSLRPTLLLH